MKFSLSILAAGLALSGLAVAEMPQAMLLVLNKSDGTLSIVDPAKLEIVTTVPVGKDPHEVVASADGTLAFASNYGDGHTLSVVDLVEGKSLPPVELGALVSPHGLAVADGNIYFTAERSKVIGRCDIATRKVDWVLGIGEETTHMIELTGDRKTIVTTNIGSGSISLVKAQGKGWEISNVRVGKGPEGMDLADGGKEIWVGNSQDGTISIVDPTEKKVTETIDAGTKRSNRLKFTPDGKLALVSDLSGTDLVVIDVAKREVTKRIPLGGGAAGIQMEPSGRKAFVALPGKNEAVVIDLKSLEIMDRLATGKGPDGMAWVVRK